MSVVRERALHTVTNYFIVSLAIADLLVAVVVMPFGVYILVSAHYKSFRNLWGQRVWIHWNIVIINAQGFSGCSALLRFNP